MNRFKTALQIQDACNVIAVSGALHQACLEARSEGLGSDAIERDGAVVLILDKLASMIDREEFKSAYDICVARQNEVKPEMKTA